MGKFTNIPLKKIEKLLKSYGWSKARQNGSHISYVKDGANRPIVIPFHEKEVDSYVVRQIIKYLNISEKEFFKQIRKV